NKDKKDNTNENTWTFSGLYDYVRNNINSFMKDPQINEMLDPKNNSTTQKLLNDHDDEDAAYSLSYFITLILILDLHGIYLSDA
ncbi:MAG: hypothetical protein MUO21_11605, partial [Nitrososphaeraceae archaeon]|nr:hypothetical protein [Nitrososphaeraceae archaeon]